MAKEKQRLKWWQVLIIIWFFTGVIELHLGLLWNIKDNIPAFLMYNGEIQMFEAIIVLIGWLWASIEG